MASRSGNYPQQNQQTPMEWLLAEESPQWEVAPYDEKNPFYFMYPDPTKEVIIEIASILKSNTSNDIVVGSKKYSRHFAIEWLTTVASARSAVVRDASIDKHINELELLELIEQVFIGEQVHSLTPEVRDQLVKNLLEATDNDAQQQKDPSGRIRLPSNQDLIAIAQRNALNAFFKSQHVDPLARSIVTSSPASIRQTWDADTVAKTTTLLVHSLPSSEIQGDLQSVTASIVKKALANTTLANSREIRDILTRSVHEQIHQRVQIEHEINAKAESLTQELVTSNNLPQKQAELVAKRFGDMVAATAAVQPKLESEQTSQLLIQAIEDIQAGNSNPVTPAKVRVVLEEAAKAAAIPVYGFSSATQKTAQQLAQRQVTALNTSIEQVQTASQTLVQELVQSERVTYAQSHQIQSRYEQMLATAIQTVPDLTPHHATQLLAEAVLDVKAAKTEPVSQTQIQNVIRSTVLPLELGISPTKTQSILEQLVDAHHQSRNEQVRVLAEAKQSLATHLINEGQVSLSQAPQVAEHYQRLVDATSRLSTTPLTEKQTENLLAVAIEHVKSGQTAASANQITQDAQKVVALKSFDAIHVSSGVQTIAAEMANNEQKAYQGAAYTLNEIAVSNQTIAKFYTDYGFSDVEAGKKVTQVKELVNHGYTVQDAVLQAGGKGFEERLTNSFNSHEEVTTFFQRVETLKPYVITPDAPSIYVGDKELVIDYFKVKGENQPISFETALDKINSVLLSNGQSPLTDKELKLYLIHPETLLKLSKLNPTYAASIEQLIGEGESFREFLRDNQSAIEIKGTRLAELFYDENLIRLNPEHGFNIFTSKIKGNIHEFNREAKAILEGLKLRVLGKGVSESKSSRTREVISKHKRQQQGESPQDIQATTEIEGHWQPAGSTQYFRGWRRILNPFRRLFHRARAAFFRTIGDWSQMGGVRGFVGKGVSWGLGKLGVKGFAQNFAKKATAKVAKKVASKLAEKGLEKGLTKLIGLLGPYGKIASVIIGVIGLNNVLKVLGAMAGVTIAVALAPLLAALSVAAKIVGAVGHAASAVGGWASTAATNVANFFTGSSATGGLSTVIANAPVIAMGATAVMGIFTMQQLAAVFMLPPYGSSSNFFADQGDYTSYSCPNTEIPASFPTGSPLEGSGWPITTGLNQNTGRSQHHNAIDIAPPTGTRVIATVTGYVLFAGWNNDGYGNLVILRSSDNAFTVYYAHLANYFVRTNDPVVKNQTIIGKVNNTGNSSGPHLHYELRSPLYGNVSIACGLGLSPNQVERINNSCPGGCGTMP